MAAARLKGPKAPLEMRFSPGHLCVRGKTDRSFVPSMLSLFPPSALLLFVLSEAGLSVTTCLPEQTGLNGFPLAGL